MNNKISFIMQDMLLLIILVFFLINPAASLAAGRNISIQKNTADSNSTSIGWDKNVTILQGEYHYPEITFQEAQDYWNRTDFLLTNVVRQNADGSWGGGYAQLEPGSVCNSTHPLIRETAHAIMGYIRAYNVTGKLSYREKAIRGLEWLLIEQQANGGFIYYCTAADSGVSLYPTGLAGRALTEGYAAFQDERYLAASYKAFQFEKKIGADKGNANFNAFPISHMVSLYQATGNKTIIPTLRAFTIQMVSTQTPEGYWGDAHNQIYYYQQIMARALIQADPILQDTAISVKKYRAVNYIVTHQNKDGSMWYNPTTPIQPVGEDEDYFSETISSRLPISNTVNGLIRYQFNRPETGIYASRIPVNMSWREGFEQKPLMSGAVYETIAAIEGRLATKNTEPYNQTEYSLSKSIYQYIERIWNLLVG